MTPAESKSAVDDGSPLYERLSALRWGPGFKGPYAMCFCEIFARLDPRRSLRAVSEALPHYDEPFERIDLLTVMGVLGFQARRRPLTQNILENASTPALVVRRNRAGREAPLALLERCDDHGRPAARVFSPSSNGVRLVPLSQLIGRGDVYAFERAQASDAERIVIGDGWFRTLMSRFNPIFRQIFALSLVINLLGLATPLFIMFVYDRVIAARIAETLPVLTGAVALALACELALRRIRSNRLAWFASRIDNIVGNMTFSKLANLPLNVAEGASVTAQILRLRSFESLRDFFSSAAFLSVIEMPFVVIYIVSIAIIGGPLVLAPTIAIAAYAALYASMRARVGVEMRRAARTGAMSQQFLLETFSRAADVQSLGLARAWLDKYKKVSRVEFDAFSKLVFAGGAVETLAQAVTALGGVATLAAGATMVFAGSISSGGLAACLILAWKIFAPFHNFCAVAQRVEQLKLSVGQIDALMRAADDEEAQTGEASLERLRGRIAFDDVGVRLAENRSPVFMNASFDVAPGELVGVVGDSGAGKTTLLKLILGAYRATYGAVRIDGFDIRQLNAAALRRRVSYAPQTPSLFDGSIEENLRLVRPEATIDDVWSALRRAGAERDVKALRHGLDANVGLERRLPHELLLRISLARAYLVDGPVFLIDETPNAILEGETGERFRFFLKSARGAKTVVLVSSRRDVLDLCERVFELTGRGLTERSEATEAAA